MHVIVILGSMAILTSSNNTAIHTLTSTVGCDSIISLNLTITTINSVVVSVNDTRFKFSLAPLVHLFNGLIVI